MNVYKEIKQLHLVMNAVIENKGKEEGILFQIGWSGSSLVLLEIFKKNSFLETI